MRSSATQVLKKDLFDENDEEVEDIEEEESKGGSLSLIHILDILEKLPFCQEKQKYLKRTLFFRQHYLMRMQHAI